ncbi:hypothetical protein CMUS01_16227 [Colletotrichum musicola]|uniref:Uncharacterized protein n=1 Tax=Colletotrichum musicola TaxID=2175873 RepID=A0A8H6IQ12_9PEZI|nr:hypothetical protein CMUS01_16227 [Colletotrichum musicola]
MSTNNNAQRAPATPSTPAARPATVAATQLVTQAPTNQELFDMLNQLREENAQLHAQLNANRAPAAPRAKYPEPEPYNSTPGLLQGFLTRTRAYLHVTASLLTVRGAEGVLRVKVFTTEG